MKFARDVLCYAFCWACYKAYIWGPSGWQMLGILPYAGMYAYSPTWREFRLTVQWNADGRPSSHPYIDFLNSAP